MAMRQRDSLHHSNDILARMARMPVQTPEPEKLARAVFLAWVLAQPDPLDTQQAVRHLMDRYGNSDHPVVRAFLGLLGETLHPRQRERRRQRLN